MARSQLEVVMLQAQEQFLSLFEVEDVIRKFEEQYKITTTEFLRNSELRATLPEDDIFQWEAFDAHRQELIRVGEELRSGYLSNVAKATPGVANLPAEEKMCLLAA
jgi:hypothetical protein